MDRRQRLYQLVPSLFKPAYNRNWKGTLDAIANENDKVDQQIQNAHDQLFLLYASGYYLESLASNVGVGKPPGVTFSDDLYREFIRICSFYPKQVKKTIYQLLEIFYGVPYCHSTVVATLPEPYNVSGNKTLDLVVDENKVIQLTFIDSSFEDPTAVTTLELVEKIKALYKKDILATVYTDGLTGDSYLSLSTTTFGLAGAMQVTGGTGQPVFAFPTEKVQYTKVSLHEILPNELTVRIPQNVPLQENDLRWVSFFHPDQTLYNTFPPDTANPWWQGGITYDTPYGTQIGLKIESALLQTNITAFSNYIILNFDDVSQFPDSGYLVFEFGTENEENSIQYYQRISNTQLKINSSYTFLKDHAVNSVVNLMTLQNVQPSTENGGYAIFFTDTEIGQYLTAYGLLLLKAAGIVVKYVYSD